jgi:hypothetical protein
MSPDWSTDATRPGYRKLVVELPETVCAGVDHISSVTGISLENYVRRALLNQLDVDRKARGAS